MLAQLLPAEDACCMLYVGAGRCTSPGKRPAGTPVARRHSRSTGEGKGKVSESPFLHFLDEQTYDGGSSS